MITQSFLYNAIFFTYTLVLGKFYGVDAEQAPLFLIAFAVGNLAGPLTLGHLFDTIGRRKMIAGTYILSGVLLAITAFLFHAGVLNAVTQTIAWCIIFFFASAGASAAYLTVSEIFPLEVRAKAIAVFFAIAQCFGALGPVIYGALIGEGESPGPLFYRLPARRRRHDHRRRGGGVPRCRRRGQVAGGRRDAAGRPQRRDPSSRHPGGGRRPPALTRHPLPGAPDGPRPGAGRGPFRRPRRDRG